MSRSRAVALVAALLVCANTLLAADTMVEIKWQKNQGLAWADKLHKVTGRRTAPIYAGDLLREYSQNEVAADKNYQGNLLVVTGQVNRVVKDDDGNAKLIMTAPDIEERQLFRNYLVICHFKQEDDQLLVDRKQGEFVHCAGKCLGLKEFLGDVYIYLDDCGAIEREYQRKLPEYEAERLASEQKAMENYKAFVKSVQEERAAERKQNASQGTLRLAKKFLAEADETRARDWLWKVVKKYPGTQAAKEARALLEPIEQGAERAMRTWTYTTGQSKVKKVKKVKGALIGVGDGRVTLRKDDGKTTSIAMERLSESDQEFARQSLQHPGEPEDVKK